METWLSGTGLGVWSRMKKREKVGGDFYSKGEMIRRAEVNVRPSNARGEGRTRRSY
jgi:hypothetical protein